jgi:hypothetical protein
MKISRHELVFNLYFATKKPSFRHKYAIFATFGPYSAHFSRGMM